MNTVTLYHNSHCSKSRATLQILEERGCKPIIIDYLKQGVTKQQIQQLLAQLNLPIRDIIRNSEDYYKTHNLDQANDETLLHHLTKEPKLLQRPIAIHNEKAIIARPPERILEIL